MTQILTRRCLATLIAALVIFVVFVLAYLALLAVVGFMAISYFESRDPNWDAGPGGIILLPIFVIVLPFAAWLTVVGSKRTIRSLSKRFELLRTGHLAADISLFVLIVGLLITGIPFVKGLVSGYLYGKGFGG